MNRACSLIAVTAALVLIGAGCAPSPHARDDLSLSIATTSGTVHGGDVGATARFTGIRYAAPPVGERRWTLPEPVSDRDADVDATRTPPACPQRPTGPGPGAADNQNEDCLFLNVTAPRHSSPDEKLPVMVWWHGGGYTTGSGAAYDPQRMAEAGHVMVVTVNYRLGMLGYLGLPGLAGAGDFGFADQLQSLRWVHDNAAAFRGDPDNVTVFGESAGGMSACAALTAPSARGLVDKAIIQSGSCLLQFPTGSLFPGVPKQRPYVSVDDSTANGTQVAAELGCAGADPLSCLRTLPIDRLLTKNDNFSDDLAFGTPLLPRDPAAALAAGQQLPVPVIAGGTHDENAAFTAGAVAAKPDAYTPQSYPADLQAAFGDRAADVERRYPVARFPSAPAALSRVFTDAGWSCPTVRATSDIARRAPAFGYEFADATGPNVSGAADPAIPPGAYHANELPYLFDLAGKNLVTSEPHHTLSQTMIGYWTSFARSGTPTATGAPPWPRAASASVPVMSFAGRSPQPTDYRADHQCDFWDGVPIG